MKGIVVKTTGKYYSVKIEDSIIIECQLKGSFRIKSIKSTNPVVVGDKVIVKKEAGLWMIIELLDRYNYIIRKSVNLSKQTHIIAANIDQAVLMITLDSPITTTNFIDRFLVSANAYGIDVCLLFNKVDIYNEKLLITQKELAEVYKKIGYKTIAVSVLKDNLSEIKKIMKNKINLIAGHSGVGKSTLVNRLQPNLNLTTKEISVIHKQGQHVTTFSELYDLDFGASIIDTPGIRGFGLVELNFNEIGNYFIEFFKIKKDCKFHNCIHLDEPDCAVKDAVESGDISAMRYKNYLDMLMDEKENYRKEKY